MIYTEKGITQLLQDNRLGGVDARIFLALSVFADNNNQVMMTQQKIADFVGVDRAQVSKSILRLHDSDLLKLVKRIGHHKLLMLNPSIVYKGTDNYKDLIVQKYKDLTLFSAIVETIAEDFNASQPKLESF